MVSNFTRDDAATVTVTLAADDAEPILRDAARHAAQFGAWCDHVTRHTVSSPWASTGPRMSFDDRRREWREEFLRAKRVVEGFGVEYEPTSEQETMGTYVPNKILKSRVVDLGGGLRVNEVLKSVPDPKNTRPRYDASVHAEACRQAADRVVRRWREKIRAATRS